MSGRFGEGNMQSFTKQGAFFRVLPISFDFFCVYAGAALIDIFADWVPAQDPDAKAQFALNFDEAQRQTKSVSVGAPS
jgi:hypothetical protein